jgi:hypothetical protein
VHPACCAYVGVFIYSSERIPARITRMTADSRVLSPLASVDVGLTSSLVSAGGDLREEFPNGKMYRVI